MPQTLNSRQVWEVVRQHRFAVLATVNARGEPRTAGIVYAAEGDTLYVATGRPTVKAKNAETNPHVSLTVTVPKRIPFMPWIKIPAATVTFQGVARVRAPSEVSAEVQKALLGPLKLEEADEHLCFIEIEPRGDFVTYGIGVPLATMRDPEAARGRASV